MPRRLLPILLSPVFALSLWCQNNTGELRLHVADPRGLGIQSIVILTSEANQINKSFPTDKTGSLDAKLLPYGVYRVEVVHEGFAPLVKEVEVRSALPAELALTLEIANLNTSVIVQDAATLIDPHRAGSMNSVGRSTIEDREGSQPGRSVIDLVNSEPGWLYEGSAVLHPRGSEYQTQYVIDGIPVTDNRSPGFSTEIEADDVQSLAIYTAGIPAEYGRKMGGVIEVNTDKDVKQGFHGKSVLGGGSFDTKNAYLLAEYGWGKNALAGSAAGSFTEWYENPPVLQNYTNRGTKGDFSGQFERDVTESDRFRILFRHELARFLVPNELIQQEAGQRQDHGAFETMGVASYQHIFSPRLLTNVRGMVRDDTATLHSNELSTPIIAGQDRGFREGYVKGTVSFSEGRHDWKAGVEANFANIHEGFNYTIPDLSQFDPGTPPSFSFFQRGRDREQAAFVEDTLRLGNWTAAAGLRWDHYQLIANENAVSPRLSIARYFPAAKMVAHFSYDRVFQTPAMENILLSSSTAVASLSPEVLRETVKPSNGNFYELGATKGFGGKVSLEVNTFLRRMNNYADDDQLLDTSVSFPIAFRKASLYGVEGNLILTRWKRLSGSASYSYIVGSAYLPVTGGLFLGSDAADALSQTNGRFWDSQDQRNTVRARYRYQLLSRAWIAASGQYGSGLPTEFSCDPDSSVSECQQGLVSQYGQKLVDRVNLDHGRVKPSFALGASAGLDLLTRDKIAMHFQVDGENLNNRINLIDFAGLFSGNAVAPPRSFSLRLTADF
jgi:hypothetical protein